MRISRTHTNESWQEKHKKNETSKNKIKTKGSRYALNTGTASNFPQNETRTRRAIYAKCTREGVVSFDVFCSLFLRYLKLCHTQAAHYGDVPTKALIIRSDRTDRDADPAFRCWSKIICRLRSGVCGRKIRL